MTEIVTREEYELMFKIFNGMTFTPRKNLINGEVDKYEILATADEVYQEYLNPQTPEPTLENKNRSDIDYILIMTGL